MYLGQDSSEARSQQQAQGAPALLLLLLLLPFGAHALVWGDVDGVCDGLMTDGQAQVSYGAHPVLLNQDVL